MTDFDSEAGPFNIYIDSYKFNGEIWLSIQTIDDESGEVQEEIKLPLAVIDTIIQQRDSLIRNATELCKEPPGTQGPTVVG